MASAAGAIAGIGLGKMLFDATKAASDLNQTVSTSSVIFGRNAREIDNWARGASRSVGLSRRAATEAAIGFGDMFQQLGFGADAAAAMSTNTVQLAADLGAFRNLPTADVVERITAAFRGEYDSLQLLIPNINAARVEQEALAATGKTAADALTAQEKAAATLAIVQRDGAKAAGAFAREADGLAGSQQTLSAEWENAQARLGDLLVGPMTGAVKLITNGLLPAFEAVVDIGGAAVGFLGDNMEVAAALAAVLGIQLVGGLAAVRIAFNRLILTNAILGLSSMLGTVLDLPGALRRAGGAVGGFLTAIAPLVAVGTVVYAISKVVEFATAADDAREEVEGMWAAVDDAPPAERLSALESMADQLQGKIRALRVEVEGLGFDLGTPLRVFEGGGADIKTLNEYEAALAEVEAQIEDTTPGLLGLEGALAAVGQTAATSGQQTQEALAEWREQLASVNESFVEPLSIYQGMMQQAAQATADATADATDSWEDYAADAKVSLEDFARSLEDQILAQENWRTNLVLISQRGGTEVAAILADMGVEGAGYVQAMVDANGEDFARMADLMIREANLGGSGATAALDTHMKVMAAIGESGGRATATAIANQLGIGVQDVLRIASQYGVNLATGINPVLASLGKPIVQVDRLRGGFTAGFWDGGYTGDGGKFTPAGIVHGGEFVFTKEQTAKAGVRNLEVYAKMLTGYATGGFVSTSAVPKPPSTAPYRTPISTGGDATMARAYGDTVDWLEANLAASGVLGPGFAGTPGQYQAMFAALKSVFPNAILTSGFRPGSITATGNLSYHALGRAIDVNPDAAMFNWIKSTYGSRIRELIFSPMGSQQVWNGQNHLYSEPTRGDHWDHIHWAMANGGVIGEPVFGVGLNSGDTYSFGERGPETVVPGVGGVGGGNFTGTLVLDSGQFMGVVRGQIREQGRANSRNLRSAR
jgi:hypothetical protein